MRTTIEKALGKLVRALDEEGFFQEGDVQITKFSFGVLQKGKQLNVRFQCDRKFDGEDPYKKLLASRFDVNRENKPLTNNTICDRIEE